MDKDVAAGFAGERWEVINCLSVTKETRRRFAGRAVDWVDRDSNVDVAALSEVSLSSTESAGSASYQRDILALLGLAGRGRWPACTSALDILLFLLRGLQNLGKYQ